MNWSDVQYLIALAGGVFAFTIQFGTLLWKISNAAASLKDKIIAIEKDMQYLATEVKLDTANLYVRKDSFNTVMTNLDSRLIRMEGKLDQAISRNGP